MPRTTKRRNFWLWMQHVAKILNRAKVTATGVTKWDYRTLRDTRGDEPRDCFAQKMTPAEYAQFLGDEYTLYGPDGE